MTNSEAIEYAKDQLEIFGGQHAEFISMAIEALSAQSEHPLLKIVQDFKEATGCNDILIVQKDAMKAWDENGVEYTMQPERMGEWQIADAYPHNVYCSECHKKFAQTHWAVWKDGSLPRNFCPNCGADMRQNKEEK